MCQAVLKFCPHSYPDSSCKSLLGGKCPLCNPQVRAKSYRSFWVSPWQGLYGRILDLQSLQLSRDRKPPSTLPYSHLCLSHTVEIRRCAIYPPLPIRAARLALGSRVGLAVPGSDFLTQVRFTCHTSPGTNDNLSRAQQWHTLAPHLLTVGKHNCQKTECWERQDCLGGEKNKKPCWTFMAFGKEMSEQQKKIQMCCIRVVSG